MTCYDVDESADTCLCESLLQLWTVLPKQIVFHIWLFRFFASGNMFRLLSFRVVVVVNFLPAWFMSFYLKDTCRKFSAHVLAPPRKCKMKASWVVTEAGSSLSPPWCSDPDLQAIKETWSHYKPGPPRTFNSSAAETFSVSSFTQECLHGSP